MIVTGAITALFVVTHLLTFKFGTVYATSEGIRDIYRLQVEIFSQPLYVLFYLVAMFIISSHLWHGLSSAAQSMGIDQPALDARCCWPARAVGGHRRRLLLHSDRHLPSLRGAR